MMLARALREEGDTPKLTNGRFLFKEDSGDVFTLNAAGAMVYRWYSERVSAREIARRLATKYRLLEGEALADVHAFLAAARAHGFLLA